MYDSVYGNTEKIAITIKDVLSKKHDVGIIRVTEAVPEDIKGVDLLILGSPTHRGQPSKPTKVFVNMLPKDSLKGKKVATFDTSLTTEGKNIFYQGFIRIFSYSAPRIAGMLKKKGGEILSSQTFFILDNKGPLKKDEIDRVKTWAKSLGLTLVRP